MPLRQDKILKEGTRRDEYAPSLVLADAMPKLWAPSEAHAKLCLKKHSPSCAARLARSSSSCRPVLPRMIPPEFYGQGEGPGEGRDAERRGWRQAVTGLKKKGAVPSPL